MVVLHVCKCERVRISGYQSAKAEVNDCRHSVRICREKKVKLASRHLTFA